ncbi:MAG: tRNA dihydrouridine synthase [Patescibacteria group bacterium]
MNNFWQKQKQKYPQGIIMLAPMADVTDNPFRRIISEVAKPDIYWNEFVSADGLVHKEGRAKLERMLSFEDDQHPIVAQIFSGDADNCEKAAQICREHGFDAIDINMGCPARNIIKQVSGAELSKAEHRDRVVRIIEATRKGASHLPVSVKTRLGFNSIDLDWIEFLLKQKLPLLTIHLRTKKEMSKVPAHWEIVDQIVDLRNRISPDTILIANGDVSNREEAYHLCAKHKIDGVMIGRGILQDITAFRQSSHLGAELPSVKERIELALRHTTYFLEEYTIDGDLTKNFNLMKKFYKVYIQGFKGAKELRAKLMMASNYKEIKEICTNFLNTHTEEGPNFMA